MSDWSLIIWCNNKPLMQEMALSFVTGYGQLGGHNVELVPIYPDEGCKSMGHAYTLGQQRAHYQNRIYMHQDVGLQDWSVLNKLEVLLDNPQIGGVGLIGATVDPASLYSHAPEHTWVGERANSEWVGVWTQTQEVKIVDGLFLATRLPLEWPLGYHGPHLCIEDACYQIRAMGKQIWVMDTPFVHRGTTYMDYTYFESLKTFRTKWKRRKMLPEVYPSTTELHARTETALDIAQEAIQSIPERKGDGFDEYIRKRMGGVLAQTGRSITKTSKE